MKRIIVPTDFTKAATNAINQAVTIALKAQADIMLLHILDVRSPSEEKSEKLLKEEVTKISEDNGLQCDYILKPGNIFDVLTMEMSKMSYDLMVIGTHGVKGLRQQLFGADILKMVSKIPLPALVVQEDSPLIKSYSRIVLPVASHHNFTIALNAVMLFARIFQTEVHLYSIDKPGFAWPEQMKKNIDHAMNLFNTNGIRIIRTNEEPTVYSLGYGKQTLNYAKSINADGICLMSVSSDEYYYFAQADKETMIGNETRIPILFAG